MSGAAHRALHADLDQRSRLRDVELYLKRGSAPDPFSPDAATKQWTFTPGGMCLKGTTASPGPWFLSQISGANTLGFRNVSLTLRFQER